MEGPLGKTLGDVYRIDQILGTGGMGTVYKAHDLSLNRDVAIKALHPHFSSDPGFRARFLQEARAIAALDHPDIVRVYAFGQDDGSLYIVMDLIRGQTLHTWLQQLAQEGKIVALPESLTIVRRLARALHYAHEEGVLHRDVKPANIMLKPLPPALREPGGLPLQPVLTDFGLAKLAAGGIQTQTDMTMGTPAYISPEQCRGEEPDRRSDIYSLGVVLFELSTGRVPFQVRSLTEAIRCHTQIPPPPPRSLNPSLPVEVENIVLRALAKRQDDRFGTAHDMAEAIQGVISRLWSGLGGPPSPIEQGAGGSGESPSPYVSLVTRLEEDTLALTTPVGDGTLLATAAAAAPGGHLIVTSPGGQTRRIPLGEKRIYTVGRSVENDLCLSDPQVSRQHVRIEFDAGRCSVVDLNSTNGTFLDRVRLLPGAPEAWMPGQVLRIGDHELHWESQGATVHSDAAATVASQTIDQLRPAQPRIRVSTPLPPEKQRIDVDEGTEGRPATRSAPLAAQPVAVPRSASRGQAERTPLLRVKSLWPPALLAIVGWGIAWVTFWITAEFFESALSGLESIGVPWEVIDISIWAARGTMVGLIGGIVTAVALRWGEPSFRLGRGIAIVLGWTVIWAAGAASAPITKIPFYETIHPILFWAIVGGVAGLLGGWLTGGALRRANPKMRGGQVTAIALGWAMSWGIEQIVVESLVRIGLPYMLDDWKLWLAVVGLAGSLGGAIGGGITFSQLRRLRQ